MTITTRIAMAAVFSLTLVAPALAGEDVTEHDTYEKRTMKVETVPAMPAPVVQPPSRVYEHHDESESTTVEKHSLIPPAPVVKERTSETTETKVVN